MESQSFFKDIKDYLPGQSIDCVIIGYDNHELHILVLKWKNMDIWTLPGGFVEKNEDMNNAAIHVLKDRTGLSFPFLDQFYTFGNVDRGESKVERNKFLKQSIINDEMRNWLRQRFITTGYFALVDIKKCNLKADIMSELCEWRPIDNLPNLIFDHREIITKALDHIRIQINYLPIGLSLLPDLFTMKELQKLYEAFLNKQLDRGNFQKKMLKLGIFIRQEKQLTGAANKAPYLYKFDEFKYNEMLKKGIGMISN